MNRKHVGHKYTHRFANTFSRLLPGVVRTGGCARTKDDQVVAPLVTFWNILDPYLPHYSIPAIPSPPTPSLHVEWMPQNGRGGVPSAWMCIGARSICSAGHLSVRLVAFSRYVRSPRTRQELMSAVSRHWYVYTSCEHALNNTPPHSCTEMNNREFMGTHFLRQLCCQIYIFQGIMSSCG